MITCQGCGSAEQLVITQHPSLARARWQATCGACQHSWDFED